MRMPHSPHILRCHAMSPSLLNQLVNSSRISLVTLVEFLDEEGLRSRNDSLGESFVHHPGINSPVSRSS